LSDGRQVLRFRPTCWERTDQRLELISSELAFDPDLRLRQSGRLCADARDLPCGDIEIQLGRQIERIDGQIKELRQLRKELHGLLAGWQSQPAKDSNVICPNLHV
jgi:hypothetical protein